MYEDRQRREVASWTRLPLAAALNERSAGVIETTVDKEAGLTVHVCTGSVTIADIGERVRSFYAGTPTPFVLWDFSDADLETVESSEIRALAETIPSFQHSRSGGRTAIVTARELSFGLGQMYSILADLAAHLAEVRTFKSGAEARAWLLDDADRSRASAAPPGETSGPRQGG